MNKKEEFVNKLIDLTIKNDLEWIPLPTHMYGSIIFNSDYNVRLFEAELKGKKILLAEKKIPEFFTDFDTHFETSRIEIYVTSDVGIELVIDEEVASKETLYEFIQTVSRKANKTDEFLNDVLEM